MTASRKPNGAHRRATRSNDHVRPTDAQLRAITSMGDAVRLCTELYGEVSTIYANGNRKKRSRHIRPVHNPLSKEATVR